VNNVQDIFQYEFERLGFAVNRLQHEPFGSHLTAANCLPGQTAILLTGHADTVHPADGEFQKVVRENDRLRGPGVYDMKGGLVLIILALKGLAETGLLHKVPLRILIAGDEEIGLPDSAPLHQELGELSSAALVFESGREQNAVITARRGCAFFKLAVQGKSAHSGSSFTQGANAICQLTHLIQQISALTDLERQLTLNVGVIQGGESPNIVPDCAWASFDLRCVSSADFELTFKALAKITADIAVPGTKAALELQRWVKPMEHSNEAAALAASYRRAAAQAGFSAEPYPGVIGGGSSANLLSSYVRTIDGLGPFGCGAHTTEEWMSIASLKEKARALAFWLIDSLQENAGRYSY